MESTAARSNAFAWQMNLMAGARVSKPPMLASSQQPDCPEKKCAKPVEIVFNLRCPGTFSNTTDMPHFSLLYEHYVKMTSQALTGRRTCNNPFLSPTLGLASSDNLVMHAVLAVSGIHYQHANRDPDILTTTYKHYGTVLKGLKYALTHWGEGTSYEQTLNLLLVAILMCMYEALGGNDNGSMSQHIRAAREFSLHLIARDPVSQNSELAAILLEAYSYFATISHFERGNVLESSQGEPIPLTLAHIRRYHTFGSYLGCAYQLYELIPAISGLVLHEKHSISRNDDPRKRDLYESLRLTVANWSAEQGHETNDAEEAAGMIVQNALLMLLHECRIDEGRGPEDVMQDIQPLIDDTMSLFELIHDDPVSTIVVWPMLITGSMMLGEGQRQRLLQLILTHYTNTMLAHRIAKLLQWVWEDEEESTFGITGLEIVAKRHKTHLCYA